MNNIHTFETEIEGKKLQIEVGRLASLANASCTARLGDTQVLATAVIGRSQRPDIDYFPLMVDYEERLYAAGKISGSRFIKREGRPSEEAVLTSRMIDRSLRPLFDHRIREDVQVVITVLSIDQENDPDTVALIAASVALSISDIPWGGPIGALRVNSVDGGYRLNVPPAPKLLGEEAEAAEEKFPDLDVFIAGNKTEVVMLETAAKEIPEDQVYGAIEYGMQHMRSLVEFIEKIQKEIGKPKRPLPEPTPEEKEARARVRERVEATAPTKIKAVFDIADKTERLNALDAARKEISAELSADAECTSALVKFGMSIIDELFALEVRTRTLETGVRVDGRKCDEVRVVSCEAGILPRTHGSGLFNRGETQVLSVATLGAPGKEQVLDTMEVSLGKKRFMHHYNFPAFSVGEVAPMRGPSRRDIGHGALAEKALRPVVPTRDVFPYTIRVVSEVLSSNGSSSQASACGSSLALMDAGVPLLAPVAGIAMGLYTNDDKSKYRILTDIQGVEDHDGDMDYKVAGTRKGITAIQLDIKLGGISLEIVKETLTAARTARESILDIMQKVMPEPRKEISQFAPRIETLHINTDRIRDLIGPGGKMINKIIDETGVDIDIDDDGTVHVTSNDAEAMAKALKMVEAVTKEIQIGEEYEGHVTQIVKERNGNGEIGALVEILPGQVGMVHISALEWRRVENVSDILHVGDTVRVKVMGVDKEKGRIELSRKAFLPKPEGYVEEPRGMGRRGFGGGTRRFDNRGSFDRGRDDRPQSGPRPMPRRNDE